MTIFNFFISKSIPKNGIDAIGTRKDIPCLIIDREIVNNFLSEKHSILISNTFFSDLFEEHFIIKEFDPSDRENMSISIIGDGY